MLFIKTLFKGFICLMPWGLKRILLKRFFKYQIHSTAKIGLAWVFPKRLIMEAGCRINHFTGAVHLDSVVMLEHSSIGRSNWITGFPSGTTSKHFAHQPTRISALLIGQHSSITKNHHLDCTNTIKIGAFTTIAGYQSQLLTHSIDIYENRQDSKPIIIGDYCFIGTNTVILGGSELPSNCVLGAKSLLNKAFTEEWFIYGGLPAKQLSIINKDAKYFSRKEGFVF